MKTQRNPMEIHAPLAAYCHQTEVSGSERWLILSGQVGMEKDGSIPPSGIEQFRVALANVKTNLLAANMDISDIVKLTIYLVDQIDASQRKALLEEFFNDYKPCMTLLYVAALASPQLNVEIDVIASSE